MSGLYLCKSGSGFGCYKLLRAIGVIHFALALLAVSVSAEEGSHGSHEGSASKTVGPALTRTEFLEAYPVHHREGFDSVPAGSAAPIQFSQVLVTGALPSDFPDANAFAFGVPQVLNSLAGLGVGFWFGENSSAPNFMVANVAGFRFNFDRHVNAVGLEANCFSCGDGSVAFIAYDSTGSVVGTSILPSFFSSSGTPRFASFSSSAPFRTLAVVRFPVGTNWLIDDLRVASDVVLLDGFEKGQAHLKKARGIQFSSGESDQ